MPEPENSQAAAEIVVGVIWRDGRILVTRRRADVHLGGLWEFPGGKVRADESHADALVREVREEVGIEVVPGGLRLHKRHVYPDRALNLYFYDCQWTAGTPECRDADAMRWVTPGDLAALPMPEANGDVVRALQEGEPGA